uniref:Uncharacterized protein n=1 Tax=Cacopsylla melanoneura TaxID=428564 RepID=A0A8D8QDC6_9HEMI
MLAILQNATNPKENSFDLSPILQNSTNSKENLFNLSPILQNSPKPKENSSDLSPILQNSTNPKEPQRKGSAADIETVDGIEYSEKLYIPQANRGKRTSGWSTAEPK